LQTALSHFLSERAIKGYVIAASLNTADSAAPRSTYMQTAFALSAQFLTCFT